MRIGVVRDDIGSVFLSDLEPNNQRSFTQSPPGQARVIRKPTDAELLAAMVGAGAGSAVVGSDTNASVDTDPNDTLRIRASSTAAYTVIAVTSGDTTAKTVIADDLNAAFAANNLPFIADVLGTDALRIRSTVVGPDAYLQIDTVGNGSTLNTPLGLTNGAYQGVSVTSVKTAVYPTSTTIDVSAATITALGSWGELDAATQTAITAAIADLVAPELVETGYAQLSFYSGVIKELRSATFQPGGTRVGLPAGVAVAVVENDGSTPF